MQQTISEASKKDIEEFPTKEIPFFSSLKNEFLLIEIDKEFSRTTSRNLTEFEKEASNIFFTPISCQENYSGNYDNYVRMTLNHISSLKCLPYEKALSNSDLFNNYPSKEIKESLISNKKLILLDLDETLIHSEYDIKDKDINKYDSIIRYKDNSSGSNELYEVGIFIRNGVKKFLSILNEYFVVGVFTASEKDYADAIIKYLDPNNKIIKFCLYRNNCININDLINIKDLRIIKDIDLDKTVLIDNNMYSFTTQLNNGILIIHFMEIKMM
jgi:Dullard-like phosphatase family protein